MNCRDFLYWLQGFLELSNTSVLTNQQANVIYNHIQLVMTNNSTNNCKDVAVVEFIHGMLVLYDGYTDKIKELTSQTIKCDDASGLDHLRSIPNLSDLRFCAHVK